MEESKYFSMGFNCCCIGMERSWLHGAALFNGDGGSGLKDVALQVLQVAVAVASHLYTLVLIECPVLLMWTKDLQCLMHCNTSTIALNASR